VQRSIATRIRSTGLALVLLALLVYLVSNPGRANLYGHYVWQADAWLHGRFAIPFPVAEGAVTNDRYLDVIPIPGSPGYGLIPYPPLPAILLLPAVAVFGLAADAGLLALALGAVSVGLAWRLVRRLVTDRRAALLATLFFSFGTGAWYAAARGSTWFEAHVVALACTLLAITLSLDAERSESPRRLDPRQVAAGFLLGLAALARLPTIFGLPFLLLVGGGRSPFRRGAAAALGAAVPLLFLLAYNLASSGAPFQPGYESLYRTETPALPAFHHPDWAIEDPRYLPQNLLIMLAEPPTIRLECGLRFFDPDCPTISPDPLGMSLPLTSPAYLLALPLLVGIRRDRLLAGAFLAIAAIAAVDLMHFSQGWVQFGYRFSNDWAPFALVPVTLALARPDARRIGVVLVAASIAVNAWGSLWGALRGW